MNLTTSTLIIFSVMALGFGATVLYDFLRGKKTHERYRLRGTVIAYGLLAPAVVLAFFFVLLPIVYSLGYSFTKYNLMHPENIRFVGFDNFVRVFERLIEEESELLRAVKNTALFVVLVVPLQILLALGLALFTNNTRPGTTIFKVCFFTPVVISLTVSAYLWSTILSPSPTGLMNSILGFFGIPTQEFLLDENTAMLWIVLMSAWQGCGYQMLIFSSALSGARKDLYEAAALDGANSWNRFLHITIPTLRPTLLYVMITVFIGACRVMIQPMIMIGPRPWGMTLSYYMYLQGFSTGNVGLSCAIALVMTIFIGGVTLAQRKLLGGKK